MRIAFHGAARTVTGSKHLLTLADGTKILLDCGLFQGMGDDTSDYNDSFGFDPAELDFLVLSHAHIDHSGLVPMLIAQGFKGVIFGTQATKELTRILLLDSAKIMDGDLKYENKRRSKKGQSLIEPRYTEEDVHKTMEYFVAVTYDNETRLTDQVTLTFIDAGHIIGSASVHLKIIENGVTKHLTFSGDVGQYGDLLLRAPQPFEQADYILLESTYGDRLHVEEQPTPASFLAAIIKTCVQKKGKLIIPAFSVGRTQELLYILNNLELEGRLPKVAVYVDSPLSAKATKIIENHAEGFNEEVLDVMETDDNPFSFPGLHYIADAEESKALNAKTEPCIIISASGMAEAGRIKHHIANGIGDAKNTILIVGYCEPTSLGGRLKNGAQQVYIFGEPHQVVADVQTIQSMSAHGDYEDLLKFLECQDPSKVKKIFLVHGEYDVQQIFKQKLIGAGFKNVEIPDRHEEFEL